MAGWSSADALSLSDANLPAHHRSGLGPALKDGRGRLAVRRKSQLGLGFSGNCYEYRSPFPLLSFQLYTFHLLFVSQSTGLGPRLTDAARCTRTDVEKPRSDRAAQASGCRQHARRWIEPAIYYLATGI